MKKYIIFVLILAFALLLNGCSNVEAGTAPNKQGTTVQNAINTEISESYDENEEVAGITETKVENKDAKKEVVDITVTKVSESDVEEPFYEDDVYIYIFGNPQSNYTVVKYSDGSEQKLVDALKEGNIKITDLDTFGIKYYTEIKPVDNPELSYEVQQSNDYNIPTDLKSMIEAVDLVIVGTYDGTVSTYATEIGQIYSFGKVSDFYILKGDVSLGSIEITFHGGSLPVSEFMKYVRPDISEKCGFDKLTKYEADTKYIGIPSTKYSVNPLETYTYLFLLNYDDENNVYVVSCDAYGVRHVTKDANRNKYEVWNPDTESYEVMPD